MADEPSSQDTARRLYEDAEKHTASAMEQLVHSNSFGELLARSTENVMGITKIGFDAFDLMVRNLRIAGRRDVVNLGRQLARTEDKLERVLQEVEQLRDELKQERATPTRSRSSTSGSRNNGSSRSRAKSSRTRAKSS
jgi:hypothetical protein